MTRHKRKSFEQNRRKYLTFIGTFLGLLATILYPAQKGDYIGASMMTTDELEEEQIGAFPITVPTVKYGFTLDTFLVTEGRVERNQTLGSLLSSRGVDVFAIEQMTKNCQESFDFTRDFRIGQEYMLLSNPETHNPEYLVFEPNILEYVVFDLKGEIEVKRVEKQVETIIKPVEGEIENSLWEALTDHGVNSEAAAKMEDALQWFVDFSHTQKGDKFKMVYEEKVVHGQSVGAGQVFAASYEREGEEFYSFWFDDGEYQGYFDLEGRPAKKGFLKAPVRFTRISSNYNLHRFHPILKRVRAHLGTDYAAPHGTPIIAVGDGVVTEAAHSKGNGRYVKIKHDDEYQTQYLHMSRFAKGIRRGTRVEQGEVIGYVGSSGLATGPHVCFRFWKNGRQVNHLRLNLPKAKPLPRSVLPEFFKVRDHYLLMLQQNENAKLQEMVNRQGISPDARKTSP